MDTFNSVRPVNRQIMTCDQANRIATCARTKIVQEIKKDDFNLRLIVGHANLLDTYMDNFPAMKQAELAAIQSRQHVDHFTICDEDDLEGEIEESHSNEIAAVASTHVHFAGSPARPSPLAAHKRCAPQSADEDDEPLRGRRRRRDSVLDTIEE